MMETKKLAVIVATVAMMAATAVPAYAQDQAANPNAQQYGAAPQGQLAQQQGQAVTTTGVVTRAPGDGGPPVQFLTDEASGVRYLLENGGHTGGFSFFEGQRVTAEGTARDTGASYEALDVSHVAAAQDGAGSNQSGSISGAPAESAKQATITGLFSVKEGGWSFVTDEETGQDYYLAGVISVDPEATAGERVVAKGEAWCGYDGPVYGCTLGVSSIKPIGKGAEKSAAPVPEAVSSGKQTAAPSETTAPAATGSENNVSGAEKANEKTAAVVSGDTSNTNKGANGSANASGGAVVQSSASPAASGSTTGVVSSAAKVLPSSVANVLPSTGGLILPVAGAAGALLIGGGLLVRKIFR